MSSSGSATVLHLDPRPSLRLRGALLLLHAAVAGGLLLALPLSLAVPGTGLLAVLLAHEWRAAQPPVHLLRDADGDWWLDGSGPYGLLPASMVTPWLLVLVLQGPVCTRRVVLLPDCLAARQWRRLRVALRTGPIPQPGT